MKLTVQKLIPLLLVALLTVTALSSCNGSQDPSASDSDTVADATVAVTDPETEPPVLDEAEAKALLKSAYESSRTKTDWEVSGSMTTIIDILDMTETVTFTDAVSSDNRMLIMKSGDFELNYTFVDEFVFMTLSTGERYCVPLSAEQKEALLAESTISEGLDTASLLADGALVGLSGERQADGSVIVTATDVTDEIKATLVDDETMTVSFKTIKVTVNADGLWSGIEMAYSLNVPETDFSAAWSSDISYSAITSYDNVTVSKPENAADYPCESYEAVFERSVPLESMMLAGQMDINADNYFIDINDSTIDAKVQGMLLFEFPHLYADKPFSVTSTVSHVDGFYYINVGDELVFLDYSDSVLGMIDGETIYFSGTFELLVSGDSMDLSSYVFSLESYESVDRPLGPNGGTYMFVNVNSTLNVRTAPTTSGNTPIGTLNRGAVVEVLEVLDGWAKITYEEAPNGYAYVSAQYLANS